MKKKSTKSKTQEVKQPDRPPINIVTTDLTLQKLKRNLGDGKLEDNKTSGAMAVPDLLRFVNKAYEMRKGLAQDSVSNADFPAPPWDEDMLLDIVKFNSYHYRCIKTIIEDAIRPGYRFEYSGKGSESDDKNKKTLEEFFSSINSNNQTSSDISVACLKDYKRLNSRMAVEIIRNRGGKIIEVKHINVFRIRPHKHAFEPENSDNYTPLFRYEYEAGKYIYFKKFGEQATYDKRDGSLVVKPINISNAATEIIYYVDYEPGTGESLNNPYYPYYGLSCLIPLITASIAFNNQRWFNIKFFKSTIKNLVMIRGRLSSDAEKRLKEFADNYLTEPEMLADLFAHSEDPDATIEIKQLMDRTIDAAFQVLFKQTRDEITSGHGVPARRIGIDETGRLGGVSGEADNEIYKDTTLAPHQRIMEDGIWNRLIRHPRGLNIQDWKIKYNRLDTIDHSYLLDMACRLVDRGIFNLGEAANTLGLEVSLSEEEKKTRVILSTYVPVKLLEQQTLDDRVPSNSMAEQKPKDTIPDEKRDLKLVKKEG